MAARNKGYRQVCSLIGSRAIILRIRITSRHLTVFPGIIESHMASRARDKLIQTAQRLFSERGFRATGIDSILEQAGVAKATLYHHFPSKTDLIVEALDGKAREFLHGLEEQIKARSPSDPRGRLIALFDVLGVWFADPEYRGCDFIRAAGEFTGEDSPVHRAAATMKSGLREILLRNARELGAADAMALADQLLLIVEGAIVVAQMSRSPQVADRAQQAARTLVDAAMAPAARG